MLQEHGLSVMMWSDHGRQGSEVLIEKLGALARCMHSSVDGYVKDHMNRYVNRYMGCDVDRHMEWNMNHDIARYFAPCAIRSLKGHGTQKNGTKTENYRAQPRCL